MLTSSYHNRRSDILVRLAVGRALSGHGRRALRGDSEDWLHDHATFQTDKVSLTSVIDRYEQRFDKRRPKLGAASWAYRTI